MANPLTVEVEKPDGTIAIYVLTGHTVTLRDGQKSTIYYFQRVTKRGMSPVDFRLEVNESLPRVQASIGQLVMMARALVTLLHYTPEQAATFVAGFWSEQARLSAGSIRTLKTELLNKLQK